MSKVIVIRYSSQGKESSKTKPSVGDYSLLIKEAFLALADEASSLPDAIKSILPTYDVTVGIKTNCLTGRLNPTPVELVFGLKELLSKSGINEENLIVWERTNRELKKAGYPVNAALGGLRCLGTDSATIGYSEDFYSSGKVNSLVSKILTEMIDVNVNMPILKDHSIAGLSGALKNMYGAIHNPNKYHGNNCDPFAADINRLDPIRKKNRLNIIGAMRVQYNGGPGYDSRYFEDYKGLIVSADPVAADRIGLEIVEKFRKVNGLPNLKDAGRPANYLQTAEEYGLGLADIAKIDLKILVVEPDGSINYSGALFDG